MSLNTTPRTWVTGEIVTAALLNTEIRDALIGVQSAWTSYTPTIAGYTSVTFNNVVGAYRRIGKTVQFRASWRINTVTTLGTAGITVTLPLNVNTGYPTNAGAGHVGTALYRTNGVAIVTGLAEVGTTAGTVTIVVPQPGGAIPNCSRLAGNAPTGQVVGDTWMITGTYETT